MYKKSHGNIILEAGNEYISSFKKIYLKFIKLLFKRIISDDCSQSDSRGTTITWVKGTSRTHVSYRFPGFIPGGKNLFV